MCLFTLGTSGRCEATTFQAHVNSNNEHQFRMSIVTEMISRYRKVLCVESRHSKVTRRRRTMMMMRTIGKRMADLVRREEGLMVSFVWWWLFSTRVLLAGLGVGRDGDLCRRSGACGDTDRTIKCVFQVGTAGRDVHTHTPPVYSRRREDKKQKKRPGERRKSKWKEETRNIRGTHTHTQEKKFWVVFQRVAAGGRRRNKN